MKTKFTITIFLLLGYSLSFSQIPSTSTTTRAVIIGISDYQDQDIPDLRFTSEELGISQRHYILDILQTS